MHREAGCWFQHADSLAWCYFLEEEQSRSQVSYHLQHHMMYNTVKLMLCIPEEQWAANDCRGTESRSQPALSSRTLTGEMSPLFWQWGAPRGDPGKQGESTQAVFSNPGGNSANHCATMFCLGHRMHRDLSEYYTTARWDKRIQSKHSHSKNLINLVGCRDVCQRHAAIHVVSWLSASVL